MKHGLLLSGVAAVVLLANGAHAQAPMQITPPAARTAASVPSKPAKKPVLAKPAVAKPAVAKPALKKSIEPKAAKSVPSPTPPMPSAFAPEQIPAAPFAAPGDAKARKHPRLAINEAGDILIPMKEGAIGADHIVAEVGELLIGSAKGRSADDDITLFKSLGLAIEDLACAHFLHHEAHKSRKGSWVEF